ncbi:MAG: DUF3810 domain-containing protein [Eubacteriales bacterium]|nr:DUF3810 domain-containing protein [Eubacteriales bacterium]
MTETGAPITGEKARKRKWKRLSGYWKWMGFLLVVDIILTILAKIPKVCDIYTDHIFKIWLETYGRVTALFPFSVGEIMLLLAALVVMIWIISVICLIVWRKSRKYRRYMTRYSKGLLALLLAVVLIMTLNCSMLYGCSKLNVNGHRGEDYSSGEIRKLWNYVASQCNRLAFEVERDDKGFPVCGGDRNRLLKQAMLKLSVTYPRLQGMYPDPKPIRCSYLMYQADCTGVYFPFSLEANYNTYLSDLGYPATAAHELSHLKGDIYEDEADFMAYMACIGSEEPFIQYSGYLSILGYLQKDYAESGQYSTEDAWLFDQVYEDYNNYYYTQETYDAIESTDAIFEKETVEAVSDGITDTYMDYYDAEPNYEEVTKLMLAYYDGILY